MERLETRRRIATRIYNDSSAAAAAGMFNPLAKEPPLTPIGLRLEESIRLRYLFSTKAAKSSGR